MVVHLTSRVQAGDVVTVEWRWPKFSADLRSARSSELFDVLFTNRVVDFRYEIRLKDVGGVQPAITQQRLRTFGEHWDGDDYVVVFSARNPAVGTPDRSGTRYATADKKAGCLAFAEQPAWVKTVFRAERGENRLPPPFRPSFDLHAVRALARVLFVESVDKAGTLHVVTLLRQ